MKTIIRYYEHQTNPDAKPMICQCCGAPMESEYRCDYCGTKYSNNQRNTTYELDDLDVITRQFPRWEFPR